MKRKIQWLFLAVLFTISFTFNAFAMEEKGTDYQLERSHPKNETRDENGRSEYVWTWVQDDLCIRFDGDERRVDRTDIQKSYNLGLTVAWYKNNDRVKRENYTGTWSQAKDGTWSFLFDDLTIPIGVTKIDGVLYAFNGYGELKDGLIYFGGGKTPFDDTGLKTGADGLVTSDDPAFLEWLATQYIPECSTHKEEAEETETAVGVDNRASVTSATKPQSWSSEYPYVDGMSSSVTDCEYVVNTNTGKIHTPGCSSVKDMAAGNTQYYIGDFSSLTSGGYTPCGRCKAK